MRVYEAKVSDGGKEYRTYVGVGEQEEIEFPNCNEHLKKFGLNDEDIHFYFTNEEWEDNLKNGLIETYDKGLKYEIFEEAKGE